MAVVWKAPLARGDASLRGNCAPNADDFCVCEVVRSGQAQILSGPVLRLENNYHDGQYINPNSKQVYTERRAMLDSQTFFRNGDEIWWRTPIRLPADWIGWFPKWDELQNWPGNPDTVTGGHDGGSLYQIHHMPSSGQGGDWSKLTIGSAPLYVVANHKDILVNVNSESSARTFLPLVRNFERGRGYEITLHVKWSPDAGSGFVEGFVDGVQTLPLRKMATSYTDVALYAIIGFYRREHIGDPSLVWSSDAKPGIDYLGFVPKKGARVFPKDDGYPQAVEYPVMDRPIMIATAREDVMATPTIPSAAATSAAVTAPAPGQTVNAAKALRGLDAMVKARQKLDADLLDLDADIAAMQLHRKDIGAARDLLAAALDAGPWT